ncbi:MAG: hypothetical protein ACREIF_10730 [Chthoniobacterales bacterium]
MPFAASWSRAETAPVGRLIPWLLREDAQLRRLPFAEVIADTTGKKIIASDPHNAADQRVIRQITTAFDEVVRQSNAPESVIQSIPRIHEVNSHFEDSLRESLDATPGLRCDFPHTAEGHVQRSGYLDLRIVDREMKRVFYLDPKLSAAGSRESNFRTLYFEPKKSTNEVLDDAVHFIAGFERETKKDGHWKFTHWDMVDLAHSKRA